MFVTIRHLPQEELRNVRGAIGTEVLEIASKVFRNNSYIRVADVVIKTHKMQRALSLAFEMTNSCETPWYKAEDLDITEEAQKGCRSTSVGDLIQVDGRKFVVSSFGFEELI